MCRGRERAAYKKQVLGHVKQTPRFRQVPAKRAYFGRTLGSPPGLPGGGITGVLPVSGVGARISGSTPEGGHSTPSDRASMSPSGSDRWPVVVPSGAIVPFCGTGWVGAQLAATAGAGGAICAGGVAGDGGACALAMREAAINAHERSQTDFILMKRERFPGPVVPRWRARI